MKWWQWVLIGIFVYGILTNIYTLNNFMEKPVDNYLESGKQAIDKVLNIVNLGETKTSEENKDKTNYGKPSCSENSDCNTIEECQTDLCSCSGGECYG